MIFCSGGESKDDFWKMVHISTDILPNHKPRYLMGVGFAEDLGMTNVKILTLRCFIIFQFTVIARIYCSCLFCFRMRHVRLCLPYKDCCKLFYL